MTPSTVSSQPLLIRYAWREAMVWRRTWHSSVASSLLTPLLFLGAMGVGVGGLVEDNMGTVEGVDYLAFVAPGLLVAYSVQSVVPQALWRVYDGAQESGGFHAAAATPIRPVDVFLGFLVWKGVYAAVHAIPFLLIAAAAGAVPSWWGVLSIPVAVLCVCASAAVLSAYSARTLNALTFAAITRLVVVPLILFSGVFFPIENLPAGLYPVAWLSPLWHGVELSRGATTGSLGGGAFVLHISYLLAFMAVGLAWGNHTFNRRLHW